ncbi:MAG TPA: hypothetical protein EYQ42_04900 [Thiotrichaceae bacterium]|jgi:ankyrin repeat protein|nr:hypothetical protein [Thiotrichaceae bacterium]HIM07354.1 hypothetical protein [Gammaproteobacteria bacterium]
MSKRNAELRRRQHSLEEEPDLVVDRHPGSNLSVLPIIVIVAIALFFAFKNNDVIQTVVDTNSLEEVISYAQKPSEVFKVSNLHQLVSTGSIADIKQQLLELDRETINEVAAGMTPIMLAASQDNVDIIDLLFTQGADPNKRGSMQRTALQYATEKNHIEAAKRLLSYGAEIDAYDDGRLTPLIMAASRGYSELALLYIEKGADVNIQHVQGWTALIDATAHGDIKLVKALIEANADKDLTAANGMKAIDYAREYGFKNIVKLLSK